MIAFMTDVFISYSRRNKLFAFTLEAALRQHGYSTWIDQAIHPAANWEEEIYRAIDAAANVLFIISPDSVISEVCNREISYARSKGKIIIPVIYRLVEERTAAGEWYDKTWEEQARANWTYLKSINWIYCRIYTPEESAAQSVAEDQQDTLAEALPRIEQSLNLDMEYKHFVSDLSLQVRAWEKGQRDPGFLLHGEELKTAIRWKNARKQPPLDDEQLVFIDESLLYEQEQQQEKAHQRQRQLELEQLSNRRLRYAAGILAVFLVVASGLSLVAFNLFGRAQSEANNRATQEIRALDNGATAVAALGEAQQRGTEVAAERDRSESLRLAAEANAILQANGGNRELAALLAIQSLRVAQTSQGQAALEQAAAQLYTNRILTAPSAYRSYIFSAWVTDEPYLFTPENRNVFVRLDPVTGLVLAQYEGHTDWLSGVDADAVSSDGRLLLTGSMDDTARLWEVATGTPLAVLPHGGDVMSVAFSPDAAVAVTGSLDRTVKFWDTSTGDLLRTIEFRQPISNVAYAPQGDLVFIGQATRPGAFYEATTGAKVRDLNGNTSTFVAVFSADGQFLFTSSLDENTVQQWEVASGELVRTLVGHSSLVYALAVSPDSAYLLTGANCANGQDCTVRRWEISSGRQVQVMSGHTAPIGTVTFNPDGTLALSSSDDDTARFWQLETGTSPDGLLPLAQDNGVPRSLVFSPDRVSFALTATRLQAEEVVDLTNMDNLLTNLEVESSVVQIWRHNQLTHTIPFEDVVTWLSYSPDGRWLAVMSRRDDFNGQDRLYIVETASGEEVYRLERGGSAFIGFVGSAGVIAYRNAEGIRLLNFISEEYEQLLNPEVYAFSPDGRFIYAFVEKSYTEPDSTDTHWLIDRQTDTRVALPVRLYPQQALFSPEQYLVLRSYVGAEVWDAARQTRLQEINAYDTTATFSNIWEMAFTPHGKLALYRTSSTPDRAEVLLYDLNSGALLHQWETATVLNLLFTPDGTGLLVGGETAVTLYDVATGLQRHQFTGRLQAYSPLENSLSPDGTILITQHPYNFQEGVRLWQLATGDELRSINGQGQGFGTLISFAFAPDTSYLVAAFVELNFAESRATGRLETWIAQPQGWITYTCGKLFRDLTPEERTLYNLQDEQPTCPAE